MRKVAVALLMLIGAYVMDVAAQDATMARAPSCMHAAKLSNLCSDVATRTPDSDPNSLYEYTYQRQVYEAACVDLERDSEEEIARKVSAVWNAYESQLVCTTLQFNVEKGSILKFAVSRTFTGFLDDAIEIWKVNLNKIDASDGRTLLDYVEHELRKNRGNPNEKVMQQYYDKLRRNGAKHRSEL